MPVSFWRPTTCSDVVCAQIYLFRLTEYFHIPQNQTTPRQLFCLGVNIRFNRFRFTEIIWFIFCPRFACRRLIVYLLFIEDEVLRSPYFVWLLRVAQFSLRHEPIFAHMPPRGESFSSSHRSWFYYAHALEHKRRIRLAARARAAISHLSHPALP